MLPFTQASCSRHTAEWLRAGPFDGQADAYATHLREAPLFFRRDAARSFHTASVGSGRLLAWMVDRTRPGPDPKLTITSVCYSDLGNNGPGAGAASVRLS
jgi:hypothetical protein